MNLTKLRQEFNIPVNKIIIDAESFMLSLLLRDKIVGYAINEKCVEDYQNMVINYMHRQGLDVYFAYLTEETNRIIEEKKLGLHHNEKIEISQQEFRDLADQAKQSPCLNVFVEGEGHSYQLDNSVLQEISNPGIYNGAITEWSGNPYYTYLLAQLANDYTVNFKTRSKLKDAGAIFANSTFKENQFDYLESYIVSDEFRMFPDEDNRETKEKQVVEIYDKLKQSVENPIKTVSKNIPYEQ